MGNDKVTPTKRKTIASYRRREAKRGVYDYGETEAAVDPAWFMRDLWTRIDTLQDANRPVCVWVDNDYIHLGTLLPEPQPASSDSETPKNHSPNHSPTGGSGESE